MSFGEDTERSNCSMAVTALANTLKSRLLDARLPWAVDKCRVLNHTQAARFAQRASIFNAMYDSSESFERQVRNACLREPDFYARRIDDLLRLVAETLSAQPSSAALITSTRIEFIYIMCDAFVDKHLVSAQLIRHMRFRNRLAKSALVLHFAEESVPLPTPPQPAVLENPQAIARHNDNDDDDAAADVDTSSRAPRTSTVWSVLSAPVTLVRRVFGRNHSQNTTR